MAEEPAGSPYEMLWLILGFLAIVIAFWFATGAYKTADVKGLFLNPPPPVGPGGSYGPQIGKPNPNVSN